MKKLTLNQKSARRDYLFYLFLSITIPVTFLFSPFPPPGTEFCGNYITLIDNIAGFPINCDSVTFTDVLVSPNFELIFTPDYVRQNRPFFILLGGVLSYIPTEFLRIFRLLYIFPETNSYLQHSIGFILLNILTLFLSLVLFHKILMYFHVQKSLIYTSSLFLVGNEIVKVFFWSALPQMFNILTPIATISIVYWGLQTKITNKILLILTFFLGFFPLAYGTCLLFFPSIVTVYFCNNKIAQNSYKKILFLFFLAVLFLLPTILWISIIKLIVGSFYSHESDTYRQFLWTVDALKINWSHFLNTAGGYWQSYLNFPQELNVLLWLNIILPIWSIFRYNRQEILSLLGTLKFIYAIFVLFFIFLYFIAFYPERLYFNLIAIALIPTLIFFNLIATREKHCYSIVPVLIFLMSTSHFLGILFQVGPYD
ncbi:MAG: hypothetical protein J7647_00145 [Cyanobacteria bacterium SBLK]|nr:hypothetical protein [Cyanobacteria bacterium SBLK]